MKEVKLDFVSEITNIFKSNEEKQIELVNAITDKHKKLDKIQRDMDSIAYEALVIEDKEAAKRYKALEDEKEAEERLLCNLESAVKAISSFKSSGSINIKARQAYDSIQQQVSEKADIFNSTLKEYSDTKEKLEKLALRLRDEYSDIHDTCQRIAPITSLLNLDDVGINKGTMDLARYQSDYDKLFKITIDPDGKVSITELDKIRYSGGNIWTLVLNY